MRISTVLTTYIARTFFWSFLATLGVIMGLILLFDTIELLRRAGGAPGRDFLTLFTMALFKLPQLVHTVLPFGVLIGAMVAFWRLTRTHELVVVRSAGVSAWQFLAPVMIVVLGIGLVNVTTFNPLAATLYGKYERLEDELMLDRDNPLTLSQKGLWLRERQENGALVLHARGVRQDGFELELRSLSLWRLGEDGRFQRRIEAARGELLDGALALETVMVMTPGEPTVSHESLRVPTSLTLAKIQDNFASPETLSFWELPDFIKFFESAGFSASEHRIYLQSLFASPLLLCAMVLLAATVTLKPNQRGGGLMWRIMLGVLAGFLLFFFTKLIYALGLSTTLPLTLAAWSPAAIAGLIGMSFMFHLEDG